LKSETGDTTSKKEKGKKKEKNIPKTMALGEINQDMDTDQARGTQSLETTSGWISQDTKRN
jgi:hypothetical protein